MRSVGKRRTDSVKRVMALSRSLFWFDNAQRSIRSRATLRRTCGRVEFDRGNDSRRRWYSRNSLSNSGSVSVGTSKSVK